MSTTLYDMNDVKRVVSTLAASIPDGEIAGDYTAYNNVETCPTWGITRYFHHKRMPAAGRAIPLEAGSAAHEFFCALRLYECYRTGLTDHFMHHGVRLFTGETFRQMCDHLHGGKDERTESLNFALEALYQSGFYDDPNDKRRTMANIETMCIHYFDHWTPKRYPLWIEDESNPKALIGAEMPFALRLVYEMHDGKEMVIYYTGKFDGLHYSSEKKERVYVHENKTGSRMDDAWKASMTMTHQVTGYCLAASQIVGSQVYAAKIFGTQLPVPVSGANAYDDSVYTREEHHYHQFFQWLLEQHQQVKRFFPEPWRATKNTHSCNRYFRPCAFVPMCDGPPEYQEEVYNGLEDDQWSPLNEREE